MSVALIFYVSPPLFSLAVYVGWLELDISAGWDSQCKCIWLASKAATINVYGFQAKLILNKCRIGWKAESFLLNNIKNIYN